MEGYDLKWGERKAEHERVWQRREIDTQKEKEKTSAERRVGKTISPLQ